MSVIAVIPARLQSSRLPNKPLLTIGGKPIVQHVYERCVSLLGHDNVYIATSDPEIRDAANKFDGQVIGSGPNPHKCGTDRCAFVAQLCDPNDIIVNVQCDQPFIEPTHIDAAVSELKHSDIGTCVTPIKMNWELFDRNVVKCVMSETNRALYFSRRPIPFDQYNPEFGCGMCPSDGVTEPNVFFRHIGLYAFRRDTLLTFAAAYRPAIETLESLEQNRALFHNMSIGCAVVSHAEHSIDCLSDYNNAIQKAGQ